jgi:hypothetical protein
LTADIEAFGKEAARRVKEWPSAGRGNAGLNAARGALHPLADRCRDLTKQIDLASKLAGRVSDIAVKELAARDVDAWNNAEVNKARKGLDEARAAAVEALRQARSLVKQADWLQERFPDAVLRDVEGLVKRVDRATVAGHEPSAWAYAERHDNIEAIYKKLTERRDTADVTELLKELHRIVNEAIRTQAPGDDQAEGLTFDLSKIDLEKLRDEFAKKVRRKATALQDIRDIVELKLAEMLERNPMRMDYQLKYEGIIANYNSDKDRTAIEETFRRLVELVQSLDEEQARAAQENLSDDELAMFDLLKRDDLTKADRERIKQASRDMLASIKARLAELDRFWEKEQTKGEIEAFILDEIFIKLPSPPFTKEEKKRVADNVYAHVWQQAMSGGFAGATPV